MEVRMVDIPYNVHGYGLCNEYLFFVFFSQQYLWQQNLIFFKEILGQFIAVLLIENRLFLTIHNGPFPVMFLVTDHG